MVIGVIIDGAVRGHVFGDRWVGTIHVVDDECSGTNRGDVEVRHFAVGTSDFDAGGGEPRAVVAEVMGDGDAVVAVEDGGRAVARRA